MYIVKKKFNAEKLVEFVKVCYDSSRCTKQNKRKFMGQSQKAKSYKR